jgi:glucose/arabinose dehydrogenase
MKAINIIGMGVLVIALLGLIALMNGEGQTAVSANSPRKVNGLPNLTAVLMAAGFDLPVDIANAGDDRLFIVEQAGLIRTIDEDGTVLPTPFLDITDRVEDGGETGLLGLTFDPDYATNGYFYVNYTYCTQASCPNSGSSPNLYTHISRFTVTADPYVADPASELILLEVQQPYANHNAGDLNFGPDGYLYIGLGDGGSGNDPENHAQTLAGDLLGKMLRLDVHGGGNAADCTSSSNYTIPAGNPFADGPGGNCDEIWALGLRNPWRFSFDSTTGEMFIGDVGQNAREEVNHQPADGGGENWGWRCYEGTLANVTSGCGDISQYDFPFFDYPRDASGGTTVTGGFVYRGGDYPDLAGYYLFADYGSGNFWLAMDDGGGGFNVTLLGSLSGISNPSTFGEGCSHELFVADYADGQIYQMQTTSVVRSGLGGGDTLYYLPVILGGGGMTPPLECSN